MLVLCAYVLSGNTHIRYRTYMLIYNVSSSATVKTKQDREMRAVWTGQPGQASQRGDVPSEVRQGMHKCLGGRGLQATRQQVQRP